MAFRVDQIDHAELTVPDRLEAADWYRRVLGLEILEDFRFWADNPAGPLMIGTADAGTKLALFQGTPGGSRRTVGFHLIAFRVDGHSFLEFLSLLGSLQLLDRHGEQVSPNCAVDHRRAFSIYFCDPWGHELELTTYDVDPVRSAASN